MGEMPGGLGLLRFWLGLLVQVGCGSKGGGGGKQAVGFAFHANLVAWRGGIKAYGIATSLVAGRITGKLFRVPSTKKAAPTCSRGTLQIDC